MTRHQISFSDLRGRRVGIFGLGIEGRAARERLVELDCDVVAVDDHPGGTGDATVLATDDRGLEALQGCDAVVKSPGISRYRDDIVRLAARVPVLGGLGMWLEEADRQRVVAVTGTKGKSTVTTVVAHLARGLGVDAVASGNLGVPPFAHAAALAGRLVVLETSSFQATDVAHSPGVVAVTALGEDHLDWHGSVARYHADKLSLTSQPGARTTVTADTRELRANAESLGGEVVWVGTDAAGLAGALGLPGRHGSQNAAVAVAVLVALGVPGSDDADALLGAARGYDALPARYHEIARRGGVRYVDDSLSTNTLSTVAAIEATGDEPLSLIVGGFDRGVDYAPLAAAIAAREAPTYLITLPDNGPSIGALVARIAGTAVDDVMDIAEAVDRATARLDGAGVVLLSPAAPSFSQFRDWADRSRSFAAAVAALAGEP